MKRSIALILILVLSICVLSGCKGNTGDATLSVGTALKENKEELSLTCTSAAVVADNDGKVVVCRLDVTKTDTEVKDGKVAAVVVDDSLFEANDNQNDGKSLRSQTEFFEKYVVGKTLSEVEKIKTGESGLVEGCTTDVTEYVKAVSAALKSNKKVSFNSTEKMQVGVGINASVSGGESANFTNDIGAVVVSDGKVIAATTDSAESTMTVADGKGDKFNYSGTKLELGDAYGMVEKGGAKAEWYVQAQNYADITVGKATNSIADLAVENISGCTIDVKPMRAALSRAAKNAR